MPAPRRTLPLLAAAACLLAPAAAMAGNVHPTTVRDTFRMQLNGTQTTTWTYAHKASGQCDADADGSGSQTWTFRSRPQKAVSYDGFTPTAFLDAKASPAKVFAFTLRGTVKRQGSIATGPAPAGDDCADGTGDGTPPKSDCGTKTVAPFTAEPQYVGRSPFIKLDQGTIVTPDYETCPIKGDTFPRLLDANSNNRYIAAKLPVDDLFEHGQNVTVAEGRQVFDDGEAKAVTKIRWELHVKRIKRETIKH